MTRKVDHVGIAVGSIDERIPFWRDALGLTVEGIEEVGSEGVRVAFLSAGPTRIELLEPASPQSAIGRFLENRGEGIHHLTFEVEDVAAAIERLQGAGIDVVDSEPRVGAGGRRVTFVHPRSSGGVLVELVEARRGAQRATLEPGAAVLVYLREPAEKLWGVLRRLDAKGVVLEGIDLASFDDWIRQVERDEPSIVGPSLLFLPMMRVERILLDRPSGQLPSLSDRFLERTGRAVQDVLGGE